MLALLEPTMLRGLERHLSAATEWFPHEYVPYEVGRNYVDEPWEETDSALGIVSRTALEVNLLTEDNLPYYHLALWEIFGRGGVWGEWVRRWTAEEGRHAIVLRDYLTVTRGADPVALERGRMDQVSRGYYPDGNGGARARSARRRRLHDAAGARDADRAPQHRDVHAGSADREAHGAHRDRREPALRLLPRPRQGGARDRRPRR